MKNMDETSGGDDDEFARYLASYLKEREDYYLVTHRSGLETIHEQKLEATIRKFISELP